MLLPVAFNPQKEREMKFCILFLLLSICFLPITQAETIWANSIVAYYGSNAASTINNSLGAPDGATTDFGTADGATWNNYLTVSFGTTFANLPGADVVVWVVDFDTSEDFRVYVSLDNVTYYQIGSASTTVENVYPSGGGYSFDMAGSGLEYARYVKILTNETDAAYVAPDLDAIGVNVPEPTSMVLLALGMVGIAARKIYKG